MKKLINLMIILCAIFIFSINSYATTSNVSLSVDKTNIKPGENICLTINFGTKLKSYIFNINYDNNIFEYVSSEGGEVTNTSNKVKIENGISAEENLKIVFKAKETIVNTNPTEFTVTGENFTAQNETENLDNIVTPLVKNVIVEPNYEPYEIKLETTGKIIKGEEKDVKLIVSSNMGKSYNKARIIAEATTPEGAIVKLTGLNVQENVMQDIIQSGWGDSQGYAIGGKDATWVLNLKALFSRSGNYKINIKLIDRANSDNIISQKEFDFAVLESNSIDLVGANNMQNTSQVGAILNSNQTNSTNTTIPKVIPKAGYNIYIPTIIVILSLISISIYYNIKSKKDY